MPATIGEDYSWPAAPDVAAEEPPKPARTSSTPAVLDWFREEHPELAKESDEDLTSYLGETKPWTLKDPEFAGAYYNRRPSARPTLLEPGTPHIAPLPRTYPGLGSPSAPDPEQIAANIAAGEKAWTAANTPPLEVQLEIERLMRARTASLEFFEDPAMRSAVERDFNAKLRALGSWAGVEEATLGQAVSTPAVRIPRVTGEQVAPLIAPLQTAAPYVAGGINAVAGLAEFFTTTLGIATLGTGALPAKAQQGIAALFAADMAIHTPEIAMEAWKAWKAGDKQAAAEYTTSGALNILFATAAARHAIKGEATPAEAIGKALNKYLDSPELKGFIETPARVPDLAWGEPITEPGWYARGGAPRYEQPPGVYGRGFEPGEEAPPAGAPPPGPSPGPPGVPPAPSEFLPAIRLKSGQIIQGAPGQIHAQVAVENNVPLEEILDRGAIRTSDQQYLPTPAPEGKSGITRSQYEAEQANLAPPKEPPPPAPAGVPPPEAVPPPPGAPPAALPPPREPAIPAPVEEPWPKTYSDPMHEDYARMDYDQYVAVWGSSKESRANYRQLLQRAVLAGKPVNAYGWTTDLRHKRPMGWKTSGDGSKAVYVPPGYVPAEAPKAAPTFEQLQADYNAALTKLREAGAKFRQAQEAYRARRIDDAEFLKAKAEFEALSTATDEAEKALLAAKPPPTGFEGEAPEVPPAPMVVGGNWKASTPLEAKPVSGQYGLVEAHGEGGMVNSFDRAFDQALQPRDRSREASAAQIQKIVANFEAQRLGEAPTTDMGAPMTDERNHVLSGNARAAALRIIYNVGRGDVYKTWLMQNAERFGLDPEAVGKMKEPILVRRVIDYGGMDKATLARLSNEHQVLGMSEAEQAASDAKLILSKASLLREFRPSETGNLLAASNRTFLNAFIHETGSAAELLGPEGYNGPALEKRVKNAVFAAVIGPENRNLLNHLIERADVLDIKNQVNGLMLAAPDLIGLKGTDYDLSAELEKALKDLVALRTTDQKVYDLVKNRDMFSPARDSDSDALLILLYEAASIKEVAEHMRRYARLARQAIADQVGGGLFGAKPKTKEELLYGREPTAPGARQEDLPPGKPGARQEEPRPQAQAPDAGGGGAEGGKGPQAPPGPVGEGPTLARMLEIQRDFKLSSAEAGVLNNALEAARDNLHKYSSAAEALQKEAIRLAVPANVSLAKIGDLKLAKRIAERYGLSERAEGYAEGYPAAGEEGEAWEKTLQEEYQKRIERRMSHERAAKAAAEETELHEQGAPPLFDQIAGTPIDTQRLAEQLVEADFAKGRWFKPNQDSAYFKPSPDSLLNESGALWHDDGIIDTQSVSPDFLKGISEREAAKVIQTMGEDAGLKWLAEVSKFQARTRVLKPEISAKLRDFGGGQRAEAMPGGLSPGGGGAIGGEPPGTAGPRPVEDDPNFSALPMGMPEALRVMRGLLEGKFPKVVEKIRAMKGKALGAFIYHEGPGAKGRIELRADIADLLTAAEKAALRNEAWEYAKRIAEPNEPIEVTQRVAQDRYDWLLHQAYESAKTRPPVLALKVVWHEIGHVVDWFQHKLIHGKGNIFARLAGLKSYFERVIALDPNKPMGTVPTPKELADLVKEAKRQMQEEIGPMREILRTIVVEEPIYRIKGIGVEDVKALFGMDAREKTPELYKWFAEQPAEVKKEIVRAAMKGIIDERMARAVGSVSEQIGTRRVEKTVRERMGREPTVEEVQKRFRELLRDEIKRRNVAELETIRKELHEAIAWWQGVEKIPDYFKTGPEMYAEAFSMFANNPAAFQKRAPTFARLMWNYMDAHPEMAKLYRDIQNELKAEQADDIEEKEMLAGWDRMEEESMEAQQEARRLKGRDFLDNVVYHISDRFGPIYRAARGYAREGEVRYAVGNFVYRATEHELVLTKMNQYVSQVLVNAGLDWKDLGRYLMYNRILNDRMNLFNPNGVTPDRAIKRLRAMEKNMGEYRWQALESAANQFRAIYQTVGALMRQARLWTPELQALIERNLEYATFDIRRETPEDGISRLLNATYGSNTTAHIYRQIGTLKETRNPATATVLKALSLISAAHRNMAKRETIRMLQDMDIVAPAKKVWTGRRQEIVIKNTDKVGTVIFLEDGKPQGYYVRKVMADALNYGNPIENKVVLGMVKATNWLKAGLTQLNYGFWPVNFRRDTQAWIAQMPGATPADLARLLPKAWTAARASVKGTYNPYALDALRRQMLISRFDPRGIWSAAENEYEARLAGYGLDPVAWRQEGDKVHKVIRAWNRYREIGQIGERVMKIAGMMYLDEAHPTMPEWKKRQIVRERAGSPDFLRRGASNPYIDLMFMFFNPWKEGWRSTIKSARENPWSFAAKGTAFVAAPTVLQAVAASGGMGDKLKQMYRSIPNYDLTNYLCIPLGWENRAERTVAYIRLPLWETARLMHGTLWQAITGRGEGILSMWGGTLPSMNAMLQAVHDFTEYEVFGHNPYDYFRGRQVLDEKTFRAGGWEARKELLKHAWNQMGGSMVGRFMEQSLDTPPDSDVQKFLKAPGVSNLIGRWIKVSNRGLDDEVRQAGEPVRQARAVTQKAVEVVIGKFMKSEALTDTERQLMREPYAHEYMNRRLREVLKGQASPVQRRLGHTQSREEKLRVFEKMMESGELAPAP